MTPSPPSAQLEREYAELRQMIEAKRQQLDALVEPIRTELGSRAQEWMDNTVRRAVAARPDRVQTIGAHGITQLKERIAGVRDATPSAIRDAIPDGAWPHQGAEPHPTIVYDDRGNSRDHTFVAAYRKVVSRIGRVLAEAGMISQGPATPATEWRSDTGGEWRYNHSLDAIRRDVPLVRQYDTLLTEFLNETSRAKQLLAAIKVAKAQELWDAN